MDERKPSIILIVISLLVIFPLGIILLYKRLTVDKSDLKKISRVSIIFVWICVVIGFFMYIALEFPLSFVLIVNIFPFLYFFYKRYKYKNLHNYYVRFYKLTSDQYEVAIDSLAKAIGKSKSKVIKIFNELMDLDFFEDAYIDKNINKIIFSDREINVYVNNTNQPNIEPQNEPKQKVVTCNNCGASAAITEGKVVKCEYCNSFLS